MVRRFSIAWICVAAGICAAGAQSCTSSGATSGVDADDGSGGDPSSDAGDSGGGRGATGGSMGGSAAGTFGGAAATGGSVTGGSSGATAAGSAGAPNSGGAGSESGGTSGSGGNTEAGTAGTEPGGTGGGGTAGKGGSGGTGGTAGTGGRGGAGGSGGTGGSAGKGGGAGAGGSPPITIPQLVGGLDGHLIVMPCGEMAATDDCMTGGVIYNGTTTACTNFTLTHQVDYAINGTPGRTYNVTLHFYGILEPKNYGTTFGVTREGGTTATNILTMTPLPWAQQSPAGGAYQGSNYNTYELHVLNPAGAIVQTYFLNSNVNESHVTFLIDYAKTIPVIGGGKVRLRMVDGNCRLMKNCTGGGAPCGAKARTVDISAANPQPSAAALIQPGLGQPDAHAGQWLLLDVTAVREQ